MRIHDPYLLESNSNKLENYEYNKEQISTSDTHFWFLDQVLMDDSGIIWSTNNILSTYTRARYGRSLKTAKQFAGWL